MSTGLGGGLSGPLPWGRTRRWSPRSHPQPDKGFAGFAWAAEVGCLGRGKGAVAGSGRPPGRCGDPSRSLGLPVPRHPSQRDQDPLLHHPRDQGHFRCRLQWDNHHQLLLGVLRDLRHVSLGPAGGGCWPQRRPLTPALLQVLGRGAGPGPPVLLLQGGAHPAAGGGAQLPGWELPDAHLHPHRELPMPGHRLRAGAGPAFGPQPCPALWPPGPALGERLSREAAPGPHLRLGPPPAC